MLSQTLHSVMSTCTSTDNDHGLLAALGVCRSDSPLVRFQRRSSVFTQDIGHVGGNMNFSVLFFGIELVKGIEARRIFDIAGAEVETCRVPATTQSRASLGGC